RQPGRDRPRGQRSGQRDERQPGARAAGNGGCAASSRHRGVTPGRAACSRVHPAPHPAAGAQSERRDVVRQARHLRGTMRATLARVGGTLLGAACLTVACAQPVQAADSPREWLDEMNRAFSALSYDGIFSYFGGEDLASLRVVHMVIDGEQRERMVHLNGAPREIVRKGDEVACIVMPGDALLELEESIPSGPFARAFVRRYDRISENYG